MSVCVSVIKNPEFPETQKINNSYPIQRQSQDLVQRQQQNVSFPSIPG